MSFNDSTYIHIIDSFIKSVEMIKSDILKDRFLCNIFYLKL